ncbi:MAG TPA: hypothetical protein VJ301_04770 [Propionibacteriaceae bacterium]|nr:hypothetical protein [Propionibacteriaceae bacterium]
MTEPDQGQLDDLEPDPGINPPQTGHAQIDDALRELADLASAPLADHHDRLAKAHEVVDEALHRPDNQANDAESG